MSRKTHSSVLVIGSFPPTRCGLATYAAEQVARMREAGRQVFTVGIRPDSTADRNFDPSSARSLLHFLCFAFSVRSRELVLHYADRYLLPFRVRPGWAFLFCRILQVGVIRILASRSEDSRVVIHEIFLDDSLSPRNRRVREALLGCFDTIAVHSEQVREGLLVSYPRLRQERVEVVDHAASMRKKFAGTREEARSHLGLLPDARVFLCLGFLSPGKGIEDVIDAWLLGSLPRGWELHLVGELRGPQIFIETLRNHGTSVSNLFLHEGFVSDEAFDAWLAAADELILSHRGVNSSGVGARAGLYGLPLLCRDLLEMRAQFPDARFFSDPRSLGALMGAGAGPAGMC